MKDSTFEKFKESLNKGILERFKVTMEIREILATVIKLGIPTFKNYSQAEILQMISSVPEDSDFAKIISEGSTEDLELCNGFYMGTELKLPENFPIKNDGIGYFYVIILLQEKMNIEEATVNVIQFAGDQYFRRPPFKEILESGAPIFNLFTIADADDEDVGITSHINYGRGNLSNSNGIDVVWSVCLFMNKDYDFS